MADTDGKTNPPAIPPNINEMEGPLIKWARCAKRKCKLTERNWETRNEKWYYCKMQYRKRNHTVRTYKDFLRFSKRQCVLNKNST